MRERRSVANSQNLFAFRLWEDRHGASTRDNSEQVIPAPADAPSVFLNEILQRNTHLFFDDARIIDVSADTEKLCALIAFPAKAREPTRTATANRRRNGDGFHVRDRRRAAKKANVRRERRLETRFALLSFQALDERGLLATDVRARATMEIYIEGITRSTCVLSEKSGLVCLCYGLLEVLGFLDELATDVDVCCGRVHATSGHEAALYEFMGIAA